MHKKSTTKISIILISIISCFFLFSCGDPSNDNSTTEPETEESKFISTYLVGSFENIEDSSFSIQFTNDNIIINPNSESLSVMTSTTTKEILFSSGILTEHEIDVTDFSISHYGNQIPLDDDYELIKEYREDYTDNYGNERWHEHKVYKLNYILLELEDNKTISDYVTIINPLKEIELNQSIKLPKYKIDTSLSLKKLTKNGNIYSGTLYVPFYSTVQSGDLTWNTKDISLKILSGIHKQGTVEYVDSSANVTYNYTSEAQVSNEIFTKEISYYEYDDNYKLDKNIRTVDFTFNVSTGELLFANDYTWNSFSVNSTSFKKIGYVPLETGDDNSSDNNNTDTNITESEITGSYTISEANGSTFTFASDGSWTYKYNSSTTNGTWSVSDGELTITYSIGGYSSTAVFTVSVSDSNYTLTGKSGDYTTIISSAFKITDQDALENGVVTLVKQ